MQNLKYPWIVGRTYKFEHGNGYWRGEVFIKGYSVEPWEEEDFDVHPDREPEAGWDALEVEILKAEPVDVFNGDKVVKLGAKAAWKWEEINVDLENK